MLLAEHGFQAKDISDRKDKSTTDSRWKDLWSSICIGKTKAIGSCAKYICLASLLRNLDLQRRNFSAD